MAVLEPRRRRADALRIAACGRCRRWRLTWRWPYCRRRPASALAAGDPAGLRVAALSRPPASRWPACWSTAGACWPASRSARSPSTSRSTARARRRRRARRRCCRSAIALGAALQAGVGAALVRRFVRQPLTLTDAARHRRLLRLLRREQRRQRRASRRSPCAAPSGRRAGDAALRPGATWWVGDLAGAADRDADRAHADRPAALRVGAAAPPGRPDDDARDRLPRPRHRPGRRAGTSERAARRVRARRVERLARPRDASSRSRCARSRRCAASSPSSATCSRADMRLATAALARLPAPCSAMGWSERVRRDDIAAFEARVRAEGTRGYRVFDRADATRRRADAGAAGAPSRRRGDVIAMRLIEPLQRNAAALGVNALSIPAARGGDRSARSTPAGRRRRPAFALTQQDDGDRADRRRHLPGDLRRRAGRRAERARRAARRRLRHAAHGRRCSRRRRPGAALPQAVRRRRRPAGAAAPPRRPAGLRERSAPACCTSGRIAFAGRQWDLRVSAEPGTACPAARDRSAWPFSRRRPAVGGDARRARC